MNPWKRKLITFGPTPFVISSPQFGVERESRPDPNQDRKTNVVTNIRNNTLHKVLIMKNKRKAFEESSAEWRAAYH